MKTSCLIKWALIIAAFICFSGCLPAIDDKDKIDIRSLKVGEIVYACGCPEMCCNSISKNPSGVCGCNYPLKRATVLKIQDNKIHVKVSGREKIFFIPFLPPFSRTLFNVPLQRHQQDTMSQAG